MSITAERKQELIKEFGVVELQDEGLLSKDEEFLLVGPGSPVEELQKLSIE